jgi:hypothetical protein
VQFLDQLGVERVTHVEQHPEQVTAAAREQAGGAVGTVRQFGGGGHDAFPGLGARARRPPQHQGNRRGGDTGAGGDVGQPGSLIH